MIAKAAFRGRLELIFSGGAYLNSDYDYLKKKKIKEVPPYKRIGALRVRAVEFEKIQRRKLNVLSVEIVKP